MLKQKQILEEMGVAENVVGTILLFGGKTPRDINQAKFIASQVENALNHFFALKEEERRFADSCKLTKESVNNEI